VGALTHSAPALDLALDFDLIRVLNKAKHRAKAVQGTET
jgi:hypothetical protein